MRQPAGEPNHVDGKFGATGETNARFFKRFAVRDLAAFTSRPLRFMRRKNDEPANFEASRRLVISSKTVVFSCGTVPNSKARVSVRAMTVSAEMTGTSTARAG